MKCLILLCLVLGLSTGYKPVVLIHGVLSDAGSMDFIKERIQQKILVRTDPHHLQLHPGTKVYATDKFSGWSSLESMWYQVLDVGADIMQIMALHPEGIHLLGYSQGGLLARGILEQFNSHNVHTFVSLSSPQCGQYGTQFLHLFFPTLACEEAYELFYSTIGQHMSVGNYWNDPHHQKLYFQYSAYLQYINNQTPSGDSNRFKEGLLRLKKMILIGGPDDEVITPWQSSHFACFDGNETVVSMENQSFYADDTLGLRSLDESRRLTLVTLSGNNHADWHMNQTVIDNYIVPHLD